MVENRHMRRCQYDRFSGSGCVARTFGITRPAPIHCFILVLCALEYVSVRSISAGSSAPAPAAADFPTKLAGAAASLRTEPQDRPPVSNPASGATPVIDVTTAPFHAKGDDDVDDTRAIQQAINAAASGTTVYFPPGTYLLSGSLVNTANVTLLGASRNASILRITRDEPYGISMASGLHVRS